jgi:hypothetical protein
MGPVATYASSAKDYLRRADDRLEENTLEGLFYAALEVRCGIEARMRQYLKAQSHITKSKISGCEIGKLAKGIEEAFRTGDQIVEFSVLDGPDGKVLTQFLYTPVTNRLQKLGQQLGNYLHATSTPAQRTDEWWADFRSKLSEAVHLLRMATTGELLGAPLLHKKTHKIQMSGEFLANDARLNFIQSAYEAKSKLVVRVGYHKEWKLEPIVEQHAS